MFDGIKASTDEIQNNTVLKLQDLAISLDVPLQDPAINLDGIEAVSEEVDYQNTSIHTNDTEQMIAALTKPFQTHSLLQEYDEDFFVFSSVHSTSLLVIATVESSLVIYYTST